MAKEKLSTCDRYFNQGVITILNQRHGKRVYGGEEYIGRPSPLGNPFVIGRDGTRDEVICKYRHWLKTVLFFKVGQEGFPEALAEFNRLYAKYVMMGELRLMCWCSPLPCHGDVIAEFLEGRVKNDSHLSN